MGDNADPRPDHARPGGLVRTRRRELVEAPDLRAVGQAVAVDVLGGGDEVDVGAGATAGY